MGGKPTYQELLAAYNKLLMENEYLHKEVDRLQSLLSSKSIPSMPSTIKQHLSLEEKVDVFRNLFKGREDVFARRWYSRTSGKSGYQPVCRNEWDRQLCDKKRYKCWLSAAKVIYFFQGMKFILPTGIESLLQSPVFIRHKQNVEFAIRKKPTFT